MTDPATGAGSNAGEDASANAVNAQPLATAPRVSARVVNLSAGGLAIELSPGQPDANEDMAWMVDPTFEGSLPLAGLTCAPLSSEPASGGGRRIKMRFEELPIMGEKEIVRGVYEHQLQAAGDRGQPPSAPRPIEDDDLPTS
jgi:c-di-GMP-binding flagellar brake protein YcgR